MRAPWDVTATATDPFSVPWEVYNLREDWTQAGDVAAKYPQKLKEMQALFTQEARQYQVFPLDTTVVSRMIAPRPSITAGRSQFTSTRPITGIPNGDAPPVLNTYYKFTAEVDIP